MSGWNRGLGRKKMLAGWRKMTGGCTGTGLLEEPAGDGQSMDPFTPARPAVDGARSANDPRRAGMTR